MVSYKYSGALLSGSAVVILLIQTHILHLFFSRSISDTSQNDYEHYMLLMLILSSCCCHS